jgi:hypothetical protein
MTAETVREEFGAPAATEADLGGDGKSCWTYWHEEQLWMFLFPATVLVLPVIALTPSIPWYYSFFSRKAVLLDFTAEKVISWERIESPTKWAWYLAPDGGGSAVEEERAFPDPPTCTSIRKPSLSGQSEVKSDAIIPTGPQWVFDPSVGRPEPDTSCESEQTTAEGRVGVGDTRYVARNYVSLWLEPTASSNEERIPVNRGQPLKILARRCGWCRVEDNVGTKGWVGCAFLESKPH